MQHSYSLFCCQHRPLLSHRPFWSKKSTRFPPLKKSAHWKLLSFQRNMWPILLSRWITAIRRKAVFANALSFLISASTAPQWSLPKAMAPLTPSVPNIVKSFQNFSMPTWYSWNIATSLSLPPNPKTGNTWQPRTLRTTYMPSPPHSKTFIRVNGSPPASAKEDRLPFFTALSIRMM